LQSEKFKKLTPLTLKIIEKKNSSPKTQNTFASSIVALAVVAFPQFNPSVDGNMASGDVVNCSGCAKRKWRTKKNTIIRNSSDVVMAQ
jgi:hypothetical protein